LAGDYILNYYGLCISIIIAFLVIMINPFIISAMSIQYTSASLTCVDYSNNATVANIKNCESLNSHFHRVDLFSELSRNLTSSSSSSSDLFEDAENTGKEDVESNTETDDLQDETTTDQANESLSSSPSSSPSNLFEDTEETEEGQDDVESNADDNILEQDATTSEKSPEGNDNTIDSQLTNST
jgi:hypothetical protein